MRALFFAVLILCCSCQSQSLSNGSTLQADPQTELPLWKGSFRPQLSLQNALHVAEEYIDGNHSGISDYWLFEAKFITFGDKRTSNQQPAWFFWWVKNDDSMGGYVELIVFMNGQIRRMPSM